MNTLRYMMLQVKATSTEQNVAQLDGTVLLSALIIILLLMMVAGIAVTVQKHKRY